MSYVQHTIGQLNGASMHFEPVIRKRPLYLWGKELHILVKKDQMQKVSIGTSAAISSIYLHKSRQQLDNDYKLYGVE